MRPLFRGLRTGLIVMAGLVLLAGVAGWLALRASLPRIEGDEILAGLSAPASIERDALGVPVIRGATREDVARATGFTHGQDRLFQMDLLRRTGAGELAALLGPAMLDADKHIRLHQFRRTASQALEAMNPVGRKLLDAYAAGVNAAIAADSLPPFEYLLLRTTPEPWRAEDSLLVVYAMWIDLQGLEAREEQQNGRLAAVLPPALYRFLTEGDRALEAPLDGSRLPQEPLPDAGEVDLRQLAPALFQQASLASDDGDVTVGSNNMGVAGIHSASGRALIANDMHLGLRVPNVWYRARFVVDTAHIDVAGVSLPGVPAIVAGSNGHVAWGFTNSYGDFQDLVALAPGPEGTDTYLTAAGLRKFEIDIETIKVAGGADQQLSVRRTIWGPVIGRDGEDRELALAWTAHSPEAADMAVLALEGAGDLEQAATIIGGAGMPAQNVLIGDAGGRIGWVLSGRLPRRHGFDPRRPAAWHENGAGWDGWYPVSESPRLLDPPDGRAWSANARVVGGDMLARIGDAGYASAARTHQIHDRLTKLENATPADLLAIELDDRADYVARWQPLMRRGLAKAGATTAESMVAAWSGRAAVDDAGYRLLREFERKAAKRAFEMLTAQARARWPDFRWHTPERFTEVALRLASEQPPHLLDPRFADWDAWLADIAMEVVNELPDGCRDIASCNWGQVNRARIRHSMSAALPFLARWLDMPAEPLPGDWSMPRVQAPAFGASERFGVSPGLEQQGYLHMPGGQSGHPLSPFYRAGFDAWARGEPTPFLPGPAQYVLRLAPPNS